MQINQGDDHDFACCFDTGGLTGIGRAAAFAFAKKGAKVVVAGRRDEAGKTLIQELRSLGAEAEFVNADVRRRTTSATWSIRPFARFGRLDVAVNNAANRRAGRFRSLIRPRKSFAATFETTFSAWS